MIESIYEVPDRRAFQYFFVGVFLLGIETPNYRRFIFTEWIGKQILAHTDLLRPASRLKAIITRGAIVLAALNLPPSRYETVAVFWMDALNPERRLLQKIVLGEAQKPANVIVEYARLTVWTPQRRRKRQPLYDRSGFAKTLMAFCAVYHFAPEPFLALNRRCKRSAYVRPPW